MRFVIETIIVKVVNDLLFNRIPQFIIIYLVKLDKGS